ncbi:MAG: hypothetical protein HOW59_12745, partial [Nonomuraea sp.]|nr:hypothetical protein [Nonomuraea sp.]
MLPYYGNVLHRVTGDVARRAEPLEAAAPEEIPFHPYLPPETAELERRLVRDMAMATAAPEE